MPKDEPQVVSKPPCHVCGEPMTVKEWKCGCGATTGCSEPLAPKVEPCFRGCTATKDRKLCADNSGLVITVCNCDCHDAPEPVAGTQVEHDALTELDQFLHSIWCGSYDDCIKRIRVWIGEKERIMQPVSRVAGTASAPQCGNGEYCNCPGDFTDGMPYCQQCGLKSRASAPQDWIGARCWKYPEDVPLTVPDSVSFPAQDLIIAANPEDRELPWAVILEDRRKMYDISELSFEGRAIGKTDWSADNYWFPRMWIETYGALSIEGRKAIIKAAAPSVAGTPAVARWPEPMKVLKHVEDEQYVNGWNNCLEACKAAQPLRTPPAPSTCPRCEGTGKYQRLPADAEKDCAICDGTGKIQEPSLESAAREIAQKGYHWLGHGEPTATKAILEILERHLHSAAQPGCKFAIGQRVFWRGQIGECSGVIMEITHPENSGYVLKLDIGDGAEIYQTASSVAAQPEPGK